MKKMIIFISVFFSFVSLCGMENVKKSKQDNEKKPKKNNVPPIVIKNRPISSIPTSGSGSGKTPIKSHQQLTEQVQQVFRPAGSFENKVVENKSK